MSRYISMALVQIHGFTNTQYQFQCDTGTKVGMDYLLDILMVHVLKGNEHNHSPTLSYYIERKWSANDL